MWEYILAEGIPVVPLYFAAERLVVRRSGTLIMVDDGRMVLEEPTNLPNYDVFAFAHLGAIR